ncbi:hypothetical protein V1509DRAFT_651465 [Lipomyces kononenkoae]
MFDLFSLKRKAATDRNAISQTPSSAPVSLPPTKRRKVDTDSRSQSKSQLPNNSPLISSASGNMPSQWSRENSTDIRSSDDELYGDVKRRNLMHSLGNYNTLDSQGTSLNGNGIRASGSSQTTEVGPDKFGKSTRNFASGPLPSLGQDGYHALPSWSRASVFSPATAAPSPVPFRSQNSLAPITTEDSRSSKATLYTPDCMRIDALSRYKVNVPPETITAPSQKSYPGSASSFKIESSDNRFILPTPTLSTNRGRVSDKFYSGPPSVIQRWSHGNLPLPDLDERAMLNSHHPSPVSSPSVGHSSQEADTSRHGDDGKSRSSLSHHYQPSPASTSTSWASHTSLPGCQPRSLPLREQSDLPEVHDQASESAAEHNSLVPVFSPESAYSAEDSVRLSASAQKNLSGNQQSIAILTGSSTDNAGYIAENDANGVTVAASQGIDARVATSYANTTSCSIFGGSRASYPDSNSCKRETQTTSALSATCPESATDKDSGVSREAFVSATSRTQGPLSLPVSSDSSSVPNTPKSPSMVQVLSSSSSTSATHSTKSIHPVLSRLKSAEPLQRRRSPGSNLSLSGLHRRESSVSMEPNDREAMSSAKFPIASNSLSTSFEHNRHKVKESSLNGYDAATKQLSPSRPKIPTRVDDSCSHCGISASILVEYAKSKEELVVKKKQWEEYFCEDQAQKAMMSEEIESMKGQIAKLQAEYEVACMDRDNLCVDRDNFKQKIDTQQKFINQLSEQLDVQRGELIRVDARPPSGGIDTASKSHALTLDSSAAVNSPPATSESVSSVSEIYDCGLNDKGSDTIIHDEIDACKDIDPVVHQMITRSRASRGTSEIEQHEISNASTESPKKAVHIQISISSRLGGGE